MFNRKDPRRPRMIRGIILHLIWLAANGESLNPDEPYSMNRGVLVAALEQLKQLPNASDLASAARYCEEKGYLEVNWEKNGTGDFESLKITAAGIDLVESTTVDAGVIIPNYR